MRVIRKHWLPHGVGHRAIDNDDSYSVIERQDCLARVLLEANNQAFACSMELDVFATNALSNLAVSYPFEVELSWFAYAIKVSMISTSQIGPWPMQMQSWSFSSTYQSAPKSQ